MSFLDSLFNNCEPTLANVYSIGHIFNVVNGNGEILGKILKYDLVTLIQTVGPVLTEFRIDRMAFGQPEHTC